MRIMVEGAPAAAAFEDAGAEPTAIDAPCAPSTAFGPPPPLRGGGYARRLLARWRGARLLRAQKFGEADAVLALALALRPDDKGLLRLHAFSAHNSGRYDIAVARWTRVIAVAPEIEMGHAGLAANLRELGLLEKAGAIIDAASQRFGDTPTILTEAARIAVARGCFAEARDLWGRAIARRRPHPDWLQGFAHALVRLGEFGTAETALRTARTRHPAHAGLMGVEGALHAAREDWPRAEAHWRAYRRAFPDDPTGWEQLGIAIEARAHMLGADSPPPCGEGLGVGVVPCFTISRDVRHDPHPSPLPAGGRGAAMPLLPAHIETVEDEATRQLLLSFESLGADCEFGLVQRRYGAEPLGLLRWNTVALTSLIAALEARFTGMGAPENTRLVVSPSGEFYVEDTRWSLPMHTFLHAGGTDADALHARMCRRVAYLRDKLIADLVAAEKIFVYHASGVDAASFAALHRALAAYGPVRLVAVRLDVGRPGEVERVAKNLFTGTLRRAGLDATGRWNIAYEDWLRLCRQVRAA